MTEINRSGSKTGQTSILGAADMNRLYHKISQEEKKIARLTVWNLYRKRLTILISIGGDGQRNVVIFH